MPNDAVVEGIADDLFNCVFMFEIGGDLLGLGPVSGLGGSYLNSSPIRQDYLETTIEWINPLRGLFRKPVLINVPDELEIVVHPRRRYYPEVVLSFVRY